MTATHGERMLVYYPGHLGPTPTVSLRDRVAEPWTGPGVRDLPASVGADLCRYSGFIEAITPEAAAERAGVEVLDLSNVTVHAEGDPAVTYVLLDRPTVTALRKLKAASVAFANEPKRGKAAKPKEG